MLNGILSFIPYLASEHLLTGELPPRTGNDHPLVAPYGLYKALDGEVAVAPSNDVVLRRFLRAVELEELLDDPRFDSNDKRFAQRDELNGMISAQMSKKRSEEHTSELQSRGH